MKLLMMDTHKATNYTDICGPRGFNYIVEEDKDYTYCKNDKGIQFVISNDRGRSFYINPKYRPYFDEFEVSSVLIEVNNLPEKVINWIKE